MEAEQLTDNSPIEADLIEIGVAAFTKRHALKDENLNSVLVAALDQLSLEQFMTLSQDNTLILFVTLRNIFYARLERKYTNSEKRFMVDVCHELMKITTPFMSTDPESNKIMVDAILARTGTPEVPIPDLRQKLSGFLTRQGRKLAENNAENKTGKD